MWENKWKESEIWVGWREREENWSTFEYHFSCYAYLSDSVCTYETGNLDFCFKRWESTKNVSETFKIWNVSYCDCYSPSILIRCQIFAKLPSLSHLADDLNLVALIEAQLIFSWCDKVKNCRHRSIVLRRWAWLSGHLRWGETLLWHRSWRAACRWRWIRNVRLNLKKTSMMTLWLPYVWLSDRSVIIVGIQVLLLLTIAVPSRVELRSL